MSLSPNHSNAAAAPTAAPTATMPPEKKPHFGFLISFVDRCNPMLVRVVRQELRNRAFIGIFMLLLSGGVIAAMVVAAITNGQLSEQSGENISRGLFGTIAVGWCFALWLVQPMGCYRSITTERGDDTWDLLELTGLRPAKVISGLMLASLVQGMLYTSVLAPFMVMAYLLRGIDLMAVLFTLIVIPLGSVAASALAVFAACLGNNKASRATLGGILGLGLFACWGISANLWFELNGLTYYFGSLRNGDVESWAITCAILNLWLGGVALLLVLSAALLSFRAANRSTGPRLMWWILWFNAWCWTLVPFIGPHFDFDDWLELQIVFAVFGVAAAGVLGLFSTTEDLALSPRQARSITDARGWWRRSAMLLLGPGAARGQLSWLAMGTISLLIGLAGWLIDGRYSYRSETNALLSAWTVFAWLAIVFLVAELLYRGWVVTWFPTPGFRRAFTLLLLALWCVLVPLALWIIDGNTKITGLYWLSPITSLILINDGNKAGENIDLFFAIFSAVGVTALIIQLRKGLRLKITTLRILARDEDHLSDGEHLAPLTFASVARMAGAV
jgi:hypothetical protein